MRKCIKIAYAFHSFARMWYAVWSPLRSISRFDYQSEKNIVAPVVTADSSKSRGLPGYYRINMVEVRIEASCCRDMGSVANSESTPGKRW